jgi:hypothetical protein
MLGMDWGIKCAVLPELELPGTIPLLNGVAMDIFASFI